MVGFAQSVGIAAVEDVIRTGDFPSEFSGGHLRMHLFRWSELRDMLTRHGARIVAASASSLGPFRDQEMLGSLSPELRDAVLRWQIELAAEAGAVDAGGHIIAVAEKPMV
jgi:hypothetical protein